MSVSILAAIGIADKLGLGDWVKEKLGKSDSTAAKVATKVVDIASQLTGETNPDLITKKLSSDPALAAKLKETLINNEHELNMAGYVDRQSARDMHKVNHQQADKIAQRIMSHNLPYIFVLLIINALVVYYLQEQGALIATISNVLGMTIKSLFDERHAVTGFYFGSSLGSKLKDNKVKE